MQLCDWPIARAIPRAAARSLVVIRVSIDARRSAPACRFASEPVRPPFFRVETRRRADGLPDCADLAGLQPCSTEDSDAHIGTTSRVVGEVPDYADLLTRIRLRRSRFNAGSA
jgi:hypothetical protein